MHSEVWAGESHERLAGHFRPQVRAANADIDHIPDGFAAVSQPSAAAHFVAECGHAFEHLLYVRHNIGAVNEDRLVRAVSECGMQHGSVFGFVDMLSVEHILDGLGQPGLLGQGDEQAHGFFGDNILGVVQEEVEELEAEFFSPLRVFGEEFLYAALRQAIVMLLEFLPGA